MSRNQRWLAHLVAFWLALAAPSEAHNIAAADKAGSTGQPIKVLAINQDADNNLAILQIDRRLRLSFPIMRYMPGPQGKVLTIEFQGAVLACAQARLTFPHAAVTDLSINQWQVYPPVVRLTFQSQDVESFKSVALESAKGRLVIRLPSARTSAVEHTYAQEQPPGKRSASQAQAPQVSAIERDAAKPRQIEVGRTPAFPAAAAPLNAASDLPAVAPDINATAPTNMPVLRGPILSSQPDDATYCVLPNKHPTEHLQPAEDKRDKPISAAARQPAAAVSDADLDQEGVLPPTRHGRVRQALKRFFSMHSPERERDATASHDSMTQEKIAFTELNPLSCRLDLSIPPATNTFRLHDPERYVIDMPAVDKNAIAVPRLPDNLTCIKAVRIGSPEGSPAVARVVVDLSSKEIQINESQDSQKHCLSLVFSKPPQEAPERAGKADARRLPPDSVVLLDAGHGGCDPGAQRGDVQEKELTLAIVERLKHVLESQNIHVKLTRADDRFVSLEDRVRLTNELKPAVFLSVHINSLETNTQATGIETYYQTDLSHDLAELIHTRLVKELGAPDRNVRRARFYVINHTPYPAVLAEVGFISNKGERDKLASSDYQLQVAQALADGLVSYLSQRSQSSAHAKPSPATGTISSLPPSSPPSAPAQATRQTFTQNLQSQRAWLPAAQSLKP